MTRPDFPPPTSPAASARNGSPGRARGESAAPPAAIVTPQTAPATGNETRGGVESPRPLWDSSRVIPGQSTRRAIALAGVFVVLLFAVPRVMTHWPYPRLGVVL